MFEVYEEKGKGGLKATGQGSYLKLMPDQLVTPFVASPTGFDDFCTMDFEGFIRAA
jgi:hypothetical protein